MDKKIDIIKVLRVPPDGQFAIEVGNRPIENIDQLAKNPQAQKIVLSAIAHLIEFAGGYEQLVKAGVAPELTPPPPPPSASVPPASPPPPTISDVEERLLNSLQPPKPAESKPAGGMRGFFQRGITAKKEPELLPTLNVAAELNALLQKQLAQMPELANTRIKVESDNYGGVQINVNGQIYEEAAQIPDPMVRMAFKMATKEWESTR